MTTPECLLFPSANRQKSLRRCLREIRFRMAAMIVAAILSLGSRLASVAAPAAPARAEPAPSAVLDPAAWSVAGVKGNTFRVEQAGGRPVVTAAGRSLFISSAGKLDADTHIRVQFRFVDPTKRSSLTFSAGLTNPADSKEKGKDITISAGASAVGWSVHDPESNARTPQTIGSYQP